MDFETLLVKGGAVSDERLLWEKVKGLDGADARRVGMKVWLEGQRRGKGELPGDAWGGGRLLVGAVVCVGMFLVGIGVMTGLLDRERMGFHVPMVVGVAVGLQLLVLVGAGFAWLVRGRFSKGFGFVQRLAAWLIGKLGGGGKMAWWRTLKLEGGRAWEALGWNLVRLTQAGAVMFSVGLMTGLLGCIWFLEVVFFWESTAPMWMAEKIFEVCGLLGRPWSWIFPEWVPTMDVIWGTRWINGVAEGGRLEFAETWYSFLFAAIFVWGLLPRLILWMFAVYKERKALSSLDFQAKRHRELWREMMGTRRADVSEAPLDGVLVLDVGGTGLEMEALRGFLLRRMRVNPGEWFEVGVWDEKGEEAAAKSIRNAPAGVVLLAEGWALSPPRMKALHSQVRGMAGPDTSVYFLVVNTGGGGEPLEVQEDEKTIWKDFADGLADASAEVFFYEKEDGV